MEKEAFKRLSALMERVIHKYAQIEQRPLDYGGGVVLSRAELHTLMVVKANPGISVTALAQRRGITKGAASQLIYKMVGKGLIKKRVSPDSDAQVSLCLTDRGEEANRLHDEYHRAGTEPFTRYLCSLPDETMDALIQVMEHFDRDLDDWLRDRQK